MATMTPYRNESFPWHGLRDLEDRINRFFFGLPGEPLTAGAVDSVNTFEAPGTVSPKPVSTRIQGDQMTLTLEPKSVTVLSIR